MRPALDLVDHALQVAALVAELIGDLDGRAGADSAQHDPLGLELPKPLRERPVGDVRQRPPELREAARPGQKRAGDRSAPAPADQLDRALEVDAELVAAHGPSATAARSTAP